MPTPPDSAVAAILAGQTRVTRRCEIYEADGITPWAPGFAPRMTDGSVSVDYTRDERRNIDVTLDNSDGAIQHDPNGGLWYDKIVKVFRGVRYANLKRQPKIAILAFDGDSTAFEYIESIGYIDIDLYTDAADFTNVMSSIENLLIYDVIISSALSADFDTTTSTFLQAAYGIGMSILTISPYATPVSVPLITTNAALGVQTSPTSWVVSEASNSIPFEDFKPYEVHANLTNTTLPSGLSAGTYIAGSTEMTSNGDVHAAPVVLYQVNATNPAKWVHYNLPIADMLPAGVTQYALNTWHFNRDILMSSIVEWLFNYQIDLSWECQIGEFMIDKIETPRFPRTIHITGRDYTKKLELSDFDNALSFDPGQSVDLLISSIAANAGITKFRLGGGTAVTASTFSFDGATARWDAISGIAEASNIEVFFDAEGYLVTRPFFDPTISPTTFTLSVGGSDGNLVDWTESSDDSELYNRIVVSGTSQDSSITGNIFQGIAENHEPSSPTSIENLNQTRSYYYSSSFFTNNAQCLAYAQSLLSYHALESFELDYSSIVFAWLEAGEILEYDAPDMAPGTPNRWLNTSFTIPLTLDAMSGIAKRITIVGDAGLASAPDTSPRWAEIPSGTEWDSLNPAMTWNNFTI